LPDASWDEAEERPGDRAGRDLAVPLALRGLGIERVIAADVTRLAKLDLVRHAAGAIPGTTRGLQDWDDVERFGITYRAPHYVSPAEGRLLLLQ
jgi:hypothetical protein